MTAENFEKVMGPIRVGYNIDAAEVAKYPWRDLVPEHILEREATLIRLVDALWKERQSTHTFLESDAPICEAPYEPTIELEALLAELAEENEG